MCDPITATVVAAAVLTAGSQVYGGMAAQAQGRYESAIAQENRKHEVAAGEDAQRRGAIEEQRRYRLLAQQAGQQRAQQAASGLDVAFGSPGDLLGDIKTIGYEDVQTIRENTKREVEGFDINAANYTMQGRAARARGNAAMVSGVMAGAGTLLGAAKQFGGPSGSAAGSKETSKASFG